MSHLTESAEVFLEKYADNIRNGYQLMEATSEEDQQARLDAFCDKCVSFFLPKPVAMGMGPPAQWESHEAGKQMLKGMIGRYIQLGLGFGGDLKSKEIKLCFDYGTHGTCIFEVVWTVRPHANSGMEPWEMRACYGYRKLPTGEEGFELAYVDDEIANLQAKVPNFFEGMGPPPS